MQPGVLTDTAYLQLQDSRRVCYNEYGDPNGRPVFYFHGTPGSRHEPTYGHADALELGYRIIAPDRPGFGGSDYCKDRQLLDWPHDVLEMAEQLGVERFGVIGASGGGPFVLACAHAIPEQLDFAAVMGSWAPVAEEPGLWLQMAPLDRFFGRLSGTLPWLFYLPFSFFGLAARRFSPQGFMKSIESSMSEADRAFAQEEGMAAFYAADIREAFRQGTRGPADDAIILYQDWGFRLDNISFPVHVFHGEDDKFAPFSFGQYLVANLPQARMYNYPSQGHLFLLRIFGDIFERVIGRD
jgi:pimeloyl-ACP methyl ester carboxylesterase